MEASESSPIDRLLESFLQATNEGEAEVLLAKIISEHAGPLIRNIVKYKIIVSGRNQSSVQDAEDVCSAATLGLLTRLQDCRGNTDGGSITNFRGYIAAIAYNTCHEHLREKYPLRHTLSNRLRYLLTHDQKFALWRGENSELLCGWSAWQDGNKPPISASRVRTLCERQATQTHSTSIDETNRGDLTRSLTAIFDQLARPVEFDDLVSLVADLYGVKDQTVPYESEEDRPSRLLERRAAGGSDFAKAVEQRSYLGKLWSEICELPENQRAALLLNLKDSQGGGGVSLFQMTRVAAIVQIAQALCISPEELAHMWAELPLDDLTIANRLGVTRQQVINLRKSARERLARRMRDYR